MCAGWAALVGALAKAELVVTAVQAVKGEMSTSVTKSGTEPSNLDAVVVCRRRTRATGRPLADPEAAAEVGEQRLAALRAAGVDVGVGDIRSVIRGHVLACYTSDPNKVHLDLLSAIADRLASEAVARISIAGRA